MQIVRMPEAAVKEDKKTVSRILGYNIDRRKWIQFTERLIRIGAQGTVILVKSHNSKGWSMWFLRSNCQAEFSSILPPNGCGK